MSILEKADKLREIAERMAKETDKSVSEVWSDAAKELDKFLNQTAIDNDQIALKD